MPPRHLRDEGIVATERIRRDCQRPHRGPGALAAPRRRLLADGGRGVPAQGSDRRHRRVRSCVADPSSIRRWSPLLARPRRASPINDLSQREREVLSLMAEGRSNTGIAARMFLTERVKGCVGTTRKLGLRARAGPASPGARRSRLHRGAWPHRADKSARGTHPHADGRRRPRLARGRHEGFMDRRRRVRDVAKGFAEPCHEPLRIHP